MDKAPNAVNISRRRFVIGSVGSGVLLAFHNPLAAAADTSIEHGYEPTIWVNIARDGKIQVNCAKAEMGQHVGTALARVVAEELEADWADVHVVHVDSDPKWGSMVTGGSWSVHTSFDLMSRVGAAGRIALIEAGAAIMGVAPEQCVARNSVITAGDKSIRYADVVASGMATRSFDEEALKKITLKPSSERRYLGRDVKALDVRSKITGEARYGIDVDIEGMVYARPILPPTRFGCSVKSFDDAAAKQIKGYLKTIKIDDPSNTCQGWLAVIAESYPAAMRAADQVKVVWNPGPQQQTSETDLQAESRRLIADASAGALFVDEGDVDEAIKQASTIIEHEYTTSTVLHFQLEPVNAVACEHNGHWHFHAGTQWQSLALPLLAQAMEVPESQITMHQYHLGGGFGRRLYADFLIPAGRVSKALGKPVKMVFTRPDDAWLDCARTPTVQRMRSGLDADGQLVSYEHHAACGWPIPGLAPAFLYEAVKGTGNVALFSISGADHWYDMPNQRVRTVENKLVSKTFQPGWLRAVGAGFVSWPIEQHIDEIAHHLKRDPVAFRLAMLNGQGRNAGTAPNSVGGGKRLAAVLKRVAEKANWDQRHELPKDTGMGVAVISGQERNMPTWVATVARVHVNRQSGEIKVEKLTSVLDAGTIVHPDGALAQAQGAMLWGMSLALKEGTQVHQGTFKDRNLDTYTPLRIHEVPELDIEFMKNDHFPTGLGEPGLSSIAPAIANAVHAAVGVRLRDLPMRPEAVKAALKNV